MVADGAILSEHQMFFLHIVVAVGMIECLLHSRSATSLSDAFPRDIPVLWRAFVVILFPLAVWGICVAILIVYILPGQSDYELVPIRDLGVPAHMWMYKADSFLVETIFLQVVVVLACVLFALSFGGVIRKNVNWFVTASFAGVVIFLAVLLFTGPSPFHCIFRINCDTQHSYWDVQNGAADWRWWVKAVS